MSLRNQFFALVAGILTLVGVIVAPPVAEAAPAPTAISTSGFTLSANYSSFNTANSMLSSALPDVDVNTVMNDANLDRQGICDPIAINMINDVTGGFCFNDTDNEDCHNTPQGITTSRDAVGGSYADGRFNHHQLVAVGWYYEETCGGATTRSRLTLVDWDAMYPNAYRKILFVEPFVSGGAGNYQDIAMHAGGMAWYGNYLYVADTHSGMRVFDMARILQVSTSGSASGIGRQSDGTYRAHNYKYVLPQIGTITASSVSPSLLWSTISLDRGTSPASLVMAEYDCVPGTRSSVCSAANDHPTRTVRYPFLPESIGGGRFASTTVASQALQLPWYKINGVTSHNGRWWFNSSGDKKLYYWTPSAGSTAYTWMSYGESMSYWEEPDGADLIWTLRELEGGRDVFAFKQASYDG
jgi:hypothetical protein